MAFRFAKNVGAFRHAMLVRNAAIVGSLTVGLTAHRSARCDVAAIPVMMPARVIATSPTTVSLSLDDSLEDSAVSRAAQKVSNFFRYLYRFLTISALATPMAALGPAAYMLGGYVPMLEDAAFSYLVWALQKLGPAFVKLGQWASTRPDLYPPRVISKLTALQDDVISDHSIETVKETLTESFGPNWKDRLELDDKPIGAGCIAQVFKGRLKGDYSDSDSKQQGRRQDKKKEGRPGPGTEVAVKVIHPHVEGSLKTDMELLSMMADAMDRIPSLRNISLGDSARSFCQSMTDQIDMTLEASNLILFRKNWAKEDWAMFPEPIQGLVTKNVLVETLMEGESMEKFMSLKETDDNGKVNQKVKRLKCTLSDMAARSMIKMIFFDNFIHGDLHPGNVMVKMDKETGEPKLIFLDCGIVFCNPDKKTHEAVIEICISFMQHDGRKAAKLMMDHSQGAHNAVKPVDMEAFIEGVHQIVIDCEEHNYFEHIGEYVMRICNLARDHRVKLDPGYFRIAMALKVAEGISLSLDRNLDMISKCLPVIVRAKAYQAMGIEDFSMSQVADDLEKTKQDLQQAEANIRSNVRAEKLKADHIINKK